MTRTPVTRAVIFTNGTVNNPFYYRDFIKDDDYIICADGGANSVLAMKLLPDVVIGDMDSLSPPQIKSLESNDVKIMRFPPEKDHSDLELALEHALSCGAGEIIIMGAFGGRIDQVYANLMLLNVPLNKGVPAGIIDETGEVRLTNKEVTMTGKKGDYLSLLPVSPIVKGVYTRGLKYPLSGESLLFSSTLGLSNEFLGTEAAVSIEEGLLVVIKINR